MTAIASEVERFDRLSATWWDASGPMRPLHVVNALREAHIGARVAARFGKSGPAPLAGVRILDIGCGAGLLCEPLARRGARVTGVDPSTGNVPAARIHAARERLAIDYRVGEPEAALRDDERFDVVLLLEVVEHVDDPAGLVGRAARHVAPGGLLFVSTIDRTWRSFAFAIVGAEYVFRVLPRGTHDWRRFVRPRELAAAAEEAGLELADLRGMHYLPVLHRASWTRDTSVNYIAEFVRGDAAAALGATPAEGRREPACAC